MPNKEEVYDREIAPLMAQILKICQEDDIPVFAHFDLGDGLLCTSCIAPPFSSERFRTFMRVAETPEPTKYAGVAIFKDDDGKTDVAITNSEGYTDAELEVIKKVALKQAEEKR